MPDRKRMQRIVRSGFAEFVAGPRPLVLKFGDSSTQVMKVVCFKRLDILGSSPVQGGSRRGPVLLLNRYECLIDRGLEQAGENDKYQRRNEIHVSQCMMNFHLWSRKNDRYIHQ